MKQRRNSPYEPQRDYALISDLAYRLDIPRGPQLVLHALMQVARTDGVCFPGLKRLAAMCKCSIRSVIRWMAELVRLGIIRRKRRGQGLTNYYYLPTMAQLEQLAAQLAGRSDKIAFAQVSGYPPTTPQHTILPSVSRFGICSLCGTNRCAHFSPLIPRKIT